MPYILLITLIFVVNGYHSAYTQDLAKSVLPLHYTIFHNIQMLIVDRTFWVTGLGWLSACFLKVMVLRIKTGKFHFNQFFATGGMPSSHSAFASGLTVSIGLTEGFTSAVFGLSMGLTILTAVDAVGLRQEAGLQAEQINQILSEIYKDKDVKQPKLRETLGHTLPEVLTGLFVGSAIAFLINYIFPL